MADPSLTLARGSLELELLPSIGGSIARLDYVAGGRTPVLRASPDPLSSPIDAACFPLVPFVNRIRGGCFRFHGREVRLSPNLAGDPSPLHGQGWTSPWRVESSSDSDAVLAFDHRSGEWPWAYEARQHIQLDDDALSIRLTCKNTSGEDMPCGLGLHPYFNCGGGTRIQTGVEDVWTVDEHVLPVAREPAVGRYAIDDDPICGRGLDNGYSDWSGRAVIADPGWPFELELRSPQARFFQVYSPQQGGFFVAEPVTHANAALNAPECDWLSLGMEILEPQGEMEVAIRLEVRGR